MKKHILIGFLCRLLFAAYMTCLVYFLLLSDGFGRTDGYTVYRYNIIPFQEITRFIQYRESMDLSLVVVNLLGNIVAFMPFGALVRWVVDRKIRWYQAIEYTFMFSLCVETLQLMAKVGVFDVDDLILNSIGGLCGFWVYTIMCAMNRKDDNKNERE